MVQYFQLVMFFIKRYLVFEESRSWTLVLLFLVLEISSTWWWPCKSGAANGATDCDGRRHPGWSWWFEIQIQIQNKLQIQTQVRMVGATDCDGGRYRGACLGCQAGFPPVSKIPFNQPVQNTNTNSCKIRIIMQIQVPPAWTPTPKVKIVVYRKCSIAFSISLGACCCQHDSFLSSPEHVIRILSFGMESCLLGE